MGKFRVKFTAKNLTGNVGIVHLGEVSDKLQLSNTLKHIISIKRGGHTADYDITEAVMILMMGMLAGQDSTSTLDCNTHSFCYLQVF